MPSLSPRALAVLALCAGMAACGPKYGANAGQLKINQVDEEPPAWKSESGRHATWREMAHWYIDNGLAEQALAMVQQLREAGVETVDLRIIQAKALNAQGVGAEAKTILQDIIDRYPREAEAYEALGVVNADLGDVPGAVEALERAVALEPADAAARNNLGFLLFATGRCDDAVAHLEDVVSRDSTNTKYRNNLAYALVCAGERERALSLFLSTSRKADAHYQMGIAYERADDTPDAMVQYQAAVDADPEHTRAAEALARLQTTPAPTDTNPDASAQPPAPNLDAGDAP